MEISIKALRTISALGLDSETVWRNYLDAKSNIQLHTDWKKPVCAISMEAEKQISDLLTANPKYKELDRSVLLAILSARMAYKDANWKESMQIGVNIGSSRGATTVFETSMETFLAGKPLSPYCSPTTTLGNISSWVAQDLRTNGPDISHSITCSSGLNAVLNGIAWLTAGFCTHFLAGASEAPLTPFTIAQMEALRIYSKATHADFPCQALQWQKKQNTMVLGEAAGMVALEPGIAENRLARITGFGYATETIEHPISLSANAECLQKTMKMALQQANRSNVDIVVMHAPGTIKGDLAEKNAVEAVFGEKIPFLTGNKWKIGHTFGTSGIMSLELAVLMLLHQKIISVPWLPSHANFPIDSVMVNAVGFGGNAVSIIVER